MLNLCIMSFANKEENSNIGSTYHIKTSPGLHAWEVVILFFDEARIIFSLSRSRQRNLPIFHTSFISIPKKIYRVIPFFSINNFLPSEIL